MEWRFIQADKEACRALLLALAYVIAWCLAAYVPDLQTGISGLPLWFELACLLIPLLFIGLCWLMVRYGFKDMPLEDDDAQ